MGCKTFGRFCCKTVGWLNASWFDDLVDKRLVGLVARRLNVLVAESSMIGFEKKLDCNEII